VDDKLAAGPSGCSDGLLLFGFNLLVYSVDMMFGRLCGVVR